MMASTRKSLQAFSLLELCIVLSVIGILTSGVWVLASIMRGNVRQDKLTQELSAIATNIRSNYMGQAYIPAGTLVALMNNLTSNNVFPEDEVHVVKVGATSYVIPDTPFGDFTNPNSALSVYQSIYACGWSSAPPPPLPAVPPSNCFNQPAGPYTLFAIEVLMPSGSDCTNAVMRNANTASFSGLVAVYVNNNSIGFPPALTTVNTNCTALTPAVPVDFVFSLTN